MRRVDWEDRKDCYELLAKRNSKKIPSRLLYGDEGDRMVEFVVEGQRQLYYEAWYSYIDKFENEL